MQTKQEISNRNYERRRERRIEQGLVTKFPTLANRQLAEKGKKYCPGCKQIKALDKFSTMKVRNKVASHCRECSKGMLSKYNQSIEGKKVNHDRYIRNKIKTKDTVLRRRFGISYEEYQTLLAKQNNCCAICKRSEKDNKKMLAVDHCHKTNKIRALLCSSCNICLGFIEKNNLDIHNISAYLDAHK